MTDDEKALAFDPFQGDFGSQDDVVLKNKMGVAREAGDSYKPLGWDCDRAVWQKVRELWAPNVAIEPRR